MGDRYRDRVRIRVRIVERGVGWGQSHIIVEIPRLGKSSARDSMRAKESYLSRFEEMLHDEEGGWSWGRVGSVQRRCLAQLGTWGWG